MCKLRRLKIESISLKLLYDLTLFWSSLDAYGSVGDPQLEVRIRPSLKNTLNDTGNCRDILHTGSPAARWWGFQSLLNECECIVTISLLICAPQLQSPVWSLKVASQMQDCEKLRHIHARLEV